MEKDKQLKEILLHSTESASPDFTQAVMRKVNQLPSASSYYQPLLSHSMKRVLILTFTILVSAIVILCMIISSPDLPFIEWIQTSLLTDKTFTKVLIYLLSFWFVFFINAVIVTNKLHAAKVSGIN